MSEQDEVRNDAAPQGDVNITVMESIVPCDQFGELLIPTIFRDDPILNQVKEIAQTFLSLMPPQAKTTNWLIGSISKDILGNERDAPSHAGHHAFDMSPMAYEDGALDVEQRMPGLAWNLMSLTLLAACSNAPYWFAVEGDHLHIDITQLDKPMFQEIGATQGCILTYPSTCDWYPITDQSLNIAPASWLMRKPFLFDWETLSLLGPAGTYKGRIVKDIFKDSLPQY